tara:strand:+ start:498 stop:1070 length:573 start_codon:yes stop_codon:yes gene_type:complete
MAIPNDDLLAITPTAIIELFELAFVPALHGASTVLRFHNGVSQNNNGDIVFGGQSYSKFPIECIGFEFSGSGGQLPTPTVTISNMSGFITSQLLSITGIATDLVGAKFTRIRTLAKFIDDANFASGSNPFGTPSSTTKFPDEIYFIDRKITETRDIVQWQLHSALDLVNVKLPKRITSPRLFPSIGKFVG